ncbi:hypothetical protein UPYG_G00071700 [Umbra pygmaea]|uniref:Orofacial cleft 1 candidate gene 1 protein n=1 Tax=Umbra pygmaea TaxID=75934 RepID=A0ABD0XWF1_UMBPY
MSAEFLMGREEENAAEGGVENPAFDGGNSAELSVSRASAGREIQRDRHDSTLAAHQQKMELRGPAKSREIMNEDEKDLYQKMAKMLDVDNDTTFTDLPGLPAQRATDPALCGSNTGHRRFMAAATVESEGEVIPHYAQQLRERVLPDMITLGSLSTEQDAHLQRGGPSQEWARKKRLMSFLRGDAKEPQGQTCREDDPQERMLEDRLYEAFQRAQSQLLKALRERRGEVIAKYGEMTEAASTAAPPWARDSVLSWQVEWSRTPQPVELRIRCLRAVRDKLPRGRYCITVALHSRMGGPNLTWSRLKEEWAGVTVPVEHGGHFYDTEMHVNQSLFTTLPAWCDVLPSMVLLFRLLGLPDDRSHVGATLGWAAFPVCSSTLTTVQGRFKTPFLRGHPHPHLDQFRKIERLISSDLDNWLCNLYFEVWKLPSGSTRGQEECIVTLQIPPQAHQSGPSGASPNLGRRDVEPPNAEACHRVSPLQLSTSHSSSVCSSSTLQGKMCTGVGPEKASQRRGCPSTVGAEPGVNYKQKQPINKINSLRPRVRERGVPPPPLLHHQSQADKQEAAGRAATPENREDLSQDEMEEYRFSLEPALPYRGLCGGSGCGRDGGAAMRTRLALRMLPSELGLSPTPLGWSSISTAAAARLSLIMLLLALIWFVRLYLHYCSQWLFLQAIAVPVNKFQFYAHTVELLYQNSLLHTREELAMVVVGPLTLNGVTTLLLLIRWACQLAFGSLPSFTSNFIMVLGVWTVLDPLAIFAVDAILGRLAYSAEAPVADAAKLYWHFYRTEQSGATGVVITVFLYSVLFILSATILYLYFLRLHNDGRMLDIFQRLTATEGSFFVPYDLEVSIQELDYITQKAEQWRGFNGERRKVAVYDYIWTEEGPLAGCAPPEGEPCGAVPTAGRESSTHVSIHTLYLSGQHQRYRHFLRQPDGAILEVIGNMERVEPSLNKKPLPGQRSPEEKHEDEGPCSTLQLRERKMKKPIWRINRVEPVGVSGHRSDLHH